MVGLQPLPNFPLKRVQAFHGGSVRMNNWGNSVVKIFVVGAKFIESPVPLAQRADRVTLFWENFSEGIGMRHRNSRFG